MTLIAAFPCADSSAVICADSQETVTLKGVEYRATRQKIAPLNCGEFTLMFGGSGSGDAIDALVHRLKESTISSNPADIDAWEKLFIRELKAFHKDKKSVYSKKERQVKAILCIHHKATARYKLWELKMDELIPIVQKPSMVGWNEFLYENEVNRLHSTSMPATQAIFLALRVLTLGRDTSNYIRDPFSLIVANKSRLWEMPASKISDFQERVTVFNRELDALMLACPDITVRSDVFDKQLQAFGSAVKQLRKEYLEETVEKMFPDFTALESNIMRTHLSPIPDLPPGSSINLMGNGAIVFHEDTAEEIEERRRMYEQAVEREEGRRKAVEEFDRLVEGRGEPLYSEDTCTIMLGRRPVSS